MECVTGNNPGKTRFYHALDRPGGMPFGQAAARFLPVEKPRVKGEMRVYANVDKYIAGETSY